MNYEDWLKSVPQEFKGDPLWNMEVYRFALFASDLAWPDVTQLLQDKRTIGLSDQLYRAVGSIGGNISEGYSRQSGKDQARFYEYALGSARESRTWYYDGRFVLSEEVAMHRIKLLTRIIRMLLTIIPSERGYKMKEESAAYDVEIDSLLNNVPMP
jgi:four helix bundle protein